MTNPKAEPQTAADLDDFLDPAVLTDPVRRLAWLHAKVEYADAQRAIGRAEAAEQSVPLDADWWEKRLAARNGSNRGMAEFVVKTLARLVDGAQATPQPDESDYDTTILEGYAGPLDRPAAHPAGSADTALREALERCVKVLVDHVSWPNNLWIRERGEAVVQARAALAAQPTSAENSE